MSEEVPLQSQWNEKKNWGSKEEAKKEIRERIHTYKLRPLAGFE
jgi:inorganic pyrophosphatase